MVRVRRMRNCQQHRFGRISRIRIGGNAVLGDDQRPVANARVINEEAAVDRILRMERETEQSLFAAGNHFRMNVEKERRRRRARLKHANRSALLDNEKSIRPVAGIGYECRA